jgi:hypothetical protein
VTLENGLTVVGANMFTSTIGAVLGSIVVPSTITSFGSGAFDGQEALTQVTFINGLTIIGEKMFNMAGFPSALASVIIPSSVTSVGKYNINHYAVHTQQSK